MNVTDIVNLIARSAREDRLVLFVGSGFSKAVVGGQKALTWLQLLQSVARHFNVEEAVPKEEKGNFDCPKIASDIVRAISGLPVNDGKKYDACEKMVKEYVCSLSDWYPNESQKAMWSRIIKGIRPAAIVTTNYDHVLEAIFEGEAVSLSAEDTIPICNGNQFLIYHVHGVRNCPQGIVLTREDYLKALRPFSYRQARLATLLKENTVLYIGYSKNDINVLSAIDTASETFSDVAATDLMSLHVMLYRNQDADVLGSLVGDICTIPNSNTKTCEIECSSVKSWLSSLSMACNRIARNEEDARDAFLADVERFTEDETDDASHLNDRRNNIRRLFENNISLLAARTKVGREFQERFYCFLENYYERIRNEAHHKGKWYRYADVWALISAYFSVVSIDPKNQNKLSPYTRWFLYVMTWFEGVAEFMRDEYGRAQQAYRWFAEDWRDMDLEVKEFIVNTSKRKELKKIIALIDTYNALQDKVNHKDD